MDLRKALGLESVTQAENTVFFEIFPDQGGASEEAAAECMRHLLPVWDNDGDFLLIEAAYSLPKWATPRVTPGRVWLRSGQLHLIAPSLADPA
ncbi:hypothetical protein H632_c260p0, partial [Helicosporidium sp. ATCC 50920]